jgi:SagB-type dehydrogenase family enzyme
MVDAREYHDRTKHTVSNVRESGFTLNRSNKPRPYKIYETLPRVSPATERTSPQRPALSAIAESRTDSSTETKHTSSDDPEIHTLCHYATGVTKELEMGGREMRFRAASCTGKLYHIDLYAVCGDCNGFDAGIYHFDPHTDGFDVLREDDYRGVLARAAGGAESITTAPVTFIATSTWWRNAWKYRTRTYRHAFWDSGTVLANLLAVGHALGQRATVVTSFADDPIARLLGFDPDEEAPLELVPVGEGDSTSTVHEIETIDPDEAPLSDHVEEYPLVADAWRQSTLPDGETAQEWRERFATDDSVGTHSLGNGERVDLNPVDADTASARPISDTIERRGSLREYSHDSISARKFATVLDRALRGVPTDCFDQDGTRRLIDAYCLVHAVEGIPSGSYQYHPNEDVLERIGDTDRRSHRA